MTAERQPRSGWIWGAAVAVTLLVMELILFSALVPADWSERVRDREQRWLRETMGPETAGRILTAAETWYAVVFVETGLVGASYELLLPDDDRGNRTPELGRLAASPLWPWVGARLAVVWQAFSLAVQRIALLLSWWPFLVFTLLGASADGLLRRRIRQSGFDYPSPLAHRLAVQALLWTGLLVSLGLFVPLPVPPLAVPVIAATSGAALSVMLTHTPKRV